MISIGFITFLKTQEILSQEQYAQVAEADPQWAAEYLFHNFWNNSYLNLAVYSEVDKEDHDLQKEMGF